MISAWCAAHVLDTIVPGPLERACWRQFAALWGDCKKCRIAPWNAIIIKSYHVGEQILNFANPQICLLTFRCFHKCKETLAELTASVSAEVRLSSSVTVLTFCFFLSCHWFQPMPHTVHSSHGATFCEHYHLHVLSGHLDRLVGLVVRRSPWKRKILGSNPACARIFSGWSHTNDLKIGTPVATLPGAWHYRVSAGSGWPGVSILWWGEVENLICHFYLSVTARKIVCADLSLRYTNLLLGCWAINKQITQSIHLLGNILWTLSLACSFQLPGASGQKFSVGLCMNE